MRRSLLLAAVLPLVLGTAVPAAGGTTPLASQDNVRLLQNVPGATGGHVVAVEDRLYVGAYGIGMRIFDISEPRSPEQIGEYYPGPRSVEDPGLRADAVPDAAVWDGRHIAALNGTGRTSGTQQTEFLDVTDPENPELLHRFTGPQDGEAHNGDFARERRLWLPSGGRDDNGFRIYDMNPVLEDPPGAPEVVFRGNPVELWAQSPYRAHTGQEVGTPSASGHHAHDLRIYEDLEILLPPWEWEEDADGEPVPTWGERDIVTLAWATGYALDGPGANDGSVFIIDITDPTDPEVINRWQNPDVDTDHIRYLHEVQLLDGDQNTLVVTDEDLHSGCESGRMYTVEVSDDLMEANKLAEWAIGEAQADTPTCAGSHVFSSKDQHVFMGAYTAGLQVIDLTDPADPVRAGRYIAEGANSWGALYHEGVVYVGDMGARGLDVFEYIWDPHAHGLLKANNPGQLHVPGATETLTECDPDSPFDEIDGMLVEIPEDKRDGQATIRALGATANADVPYNLNVYFYDENCTFLSGMSLNSDGPDEEGPIPFFAAYAYVDLIVGPPMHVYVQIDP